MELSNLYGAEYQVFMKKEMQTGTALTTTSDEDSAMAFYSNAAHPETIMALMMRLAMLKQPRGATELERAYILKDYTQRLSHHQVKEIDLFEAVEHFVENDTGDFFPTYAKFHKQIFGTSEARTHD